MKKKIDEKKKTEKNAEAETGWATAQLGHDTMELYRDIAVLGVQGCAAKGHDMTTARPRYGQAACDTVEGVRDTARSALGWEQGHDTKICIVAEGGGGGGGGGDFRSQYNGTALRYNAAARHDTVQGGLRHGRA